MAQIAKIKLNKEIYGSKGTIDSLDTDFKELKIKKYTVGEFFDLYRDLFFEIEKEGRLSHTTIIAKSTEYAGTPPNPKDQTILDLQESIKQLQWDIDSIEEKHPFLLNNETVIQSRNEPSLRYYIQSGRRRQIKDNNVFNLLKKRSGFSTDTPNEDFSVLLNADAIMGILPGPDINSQTDLNLDIAYINRFTPGLDKDDPLSNIKITIKKTDLRSNISIPEINNYNPMVNIEEPPPTPDALNLSSIINSNSFNESNASLNNYRYKTNS
mgnify:CR=1 FL=1|tara:strand:+ start:1935 stop:2738 length:804 start_codon:yes stop_codon:yes gene_type:complete